MSQPVSRALDLISTIKNNPENYLFHYTRTTTALNSIIPSNTIRFSPLTETNDLEESRRFEDLHLIHDGTDQTSSMNVLMEAIRVLPCRYRSASFCMSRLSNPHDNLTNDRYGFSFPRMWATYGDNHNGICLIFHLPELISSLMRFSDKEHLTGGRVQYLSDCELISQNISNNPRAIPTPLTDIEQINKHIRERSHFFFFRKHIDWRDECEYRFIYYGEENPGQPLDIDYGSALVGIAIGKRISYQIKREIADIANSNSLPYFVNEFTSMGILQLPFDIEVPDRP